MKKYAFCWQFMGALSFLVGGCDTTTEEPAVFQWAEAPVDNGVAGEVVLLTVRAPGGGLVAVTVEGGGGSVMATEVTADGSGHLALQWRLGVAPVLNRIRLSTEGFDDLSVNVKGELETPSGTERFGDVAGWLADEEVEGSTEDLAFVGDALVMGVPAGLVSLDSDGALTSWSLDGDPMVQPLGVAVDREGWAVAAAAWAVAVQAGRPGLSHCRP